MYKHILCPVDGSATSNCGMIEAIKLAKNQQATLRFINVIDLYFPIADATGEFNVVYIDDILRKNGHKVLKSAETEAAKSGVKAETKMVETVGHRVSKLILDEASAWPADLIVMGTHGLRGVERLVLGSDAETVIRKSTVPVLLVKHMHAAEPDK
ncbi:MAG TPA: universal stress protein [Methylophilaceae bacterium]|nr:universal stress protein [Methylophilaceae bacterium]HQC29092.1 universal stress protein [Methylotenera sp.]